MADFQLHITGTLGLLLGVCLAAGVFADMLHLPKVTAYLLVGLLVGPSVLDWIPAGHVELFAPEVGDGGRVVQPGLRVHVHKGTTRRRPLPGAFGGRDRGHASLGNVGLCLFGCSGSMALLLGCLAVATAPATTILVLKEFRSEGPVTESTGFLVAMNNFACIVMFEFGFLTIQFTQGKLDTTPGNSWVLLNIAGSMLLGIVGGLIVSYGCGFLNASAGWCCLSPRQHSCSASMNRWTSPTC